MNFFVLGERPLVRLTGVTALVLGASIATACADKPVDPNSRDRKHHSGTGGSDADGGASNDAGASGEGGEVSTGGAPASGGAQSTGGTSTGGAGTGGTNTGGDVGTGGALGTGGAGTGGAGTGGTSTGGVGTGGAGTGGTSTGGVSSGGTSAGGTGTGGDLGMGGDPGTDPVNLLPNGTFESNANGWFSWAGTVSRTTTRSHGGSGSGLLSARTSSGAPMATDLFNPGSANNVVLPGHTYTVTFWVAIANATTADVNLTRKIGCNKTPGVPADGSNDTYSWLVSPKAVKDGEWVEFTSTLTVPDATTCDLSDVLVYIEGPASTVDLYVDDVAVYEN